ncbi:hypothetical protein M413DRAFT_25155 [Hebeloma cylindrosporum]|uniref:PX domain-containing protein n=1 Tax=Hebeloma cylindrosporum TaxID=76867 RepID=A0A0C2Y4E7_HEBCY|nr:hypothetical protein M413DRAFT_25155 [Hebeloma cylindrosporum h7]
MEGFDDLLGPSRQALEENPFADPFLKRSSSPDPWANPFASTDSSDAFGNTSAHFASPEPSNSSISNDIGSNSSAVVDESPIADPLDSAASAADDDDDDNEPLAKLRSPGFRESVPRIFSETVTIRPPHDEDLDSKSSIDNESTMPGLPTPEPASTSTTARTPQPPSRSNSSFASPPPSATESNFKSPLETPFGGLNRSMAGLSLGGEAQGGWNPAEAQTPWQAEQITPVPAKPSQGDDDSDDDRPILQSYHKQHEDKSSPPTPTRIDKGLQPVFLISVDDPQKVGDPIRSFTMYTVHTRTTSPLFQKSAFSVLRRYSDFLWLYETLSNNNPGVVVPPVPEKSPFGRFDDHFVKQRRVALEKCIQKTANHPVLGRDPDLRLFLESDSFALDIKHRKAELANERGGLIASIGQTIAGPRFYETDEWFDRQKIYLDSLESQLRGLAKAIELVAKHRSGMGYFEEISVATGEFAQNVSDLSSSDIGKQLAQSLSGLADVERTAQDIQNVQSEQDMATLMATVDEYARLINSVRLAFSSRIRVFHAWKNQESELLRTKQTHEKNRAQGRIPTDRLGYSLSQIAEAERRASEAKLEYEHVSKLVKAEVARFEQERIEDFKDSLHAFLEGMISRQKELISAWENYQQMLLKRVGGGGPAGTRSASGPSSSL